MRVFSFEDLRLGRIPNGECFARSERALRAFVQRHSSVTGVLLGSVLTNPTPTSDLDVVFFFDDQDGVIPYLGAALELAEHTSMLHVPLELIALDPALLASGCSRINLGFREHIRWALRQDGGLLGGDGNRLLQLMDRHVGGTLAGDARFYAGLKLQKLSEAIVSFSILPPVRQLDLLGELLSTPIHAARKVLHAYHPDFNPGWTKRQIVERWEESDPRPDDETHPLRRVYEVGEEYTAYVNSFLVATSAEERDHKRLMAKIWNLRLPVLDLLRYILTTDFSIRS